MLRPVARASAVTSTPVVIPKTDHEEGAQAATRTAAVEAAAPEPGPQGYHTDNTDVENLGPGPAPTGLVVDGAAAGKLQDEAALGFIAAEGSTFASRKAQRANEREAERIEHEKQKQQIRNEMDANGVPPEKQKEMLARYSEDLARLRVAARAYCTPALADEILKRGPLQIPDDLAKRFFDPIGSPVSTDSGTAYKWASDAYEQLLDRVRGIKVESPHHTLVRARDEALKLERDLQTIVGRADPGELDNAQRFAGRALGLTAALQALDAETVLAGYPDL
jgi:hypothetical protein